MRNFFPEQLRFIADACDALNQIPEPSPDEELTGMVLGPVPVKYASDGKVVGHLIDEVGGAFSFFPVEDES